MNDKVAWASGAAGTVLVTSNGGEIWNRRMVEGAQALDFRDIEAFDGQTAYILSIGESNLSRIYKTSDGGATWSLKHTNPDPKGFLDALAFWDESHGLVLGDPVEGKFVILTTDDAGKNWTRNAPQRHARRTSRRRRVRRERHVPGGPGQLRAPGSAPAPDGSSAAPTAGEAGPSTRRPFARETAPPGYSRWFSGTPSMALPSAAITRSPTAPANSVLSRPTAAARGGCRAERSRPVIAPPSLSCQVPPDRSFWLSVPPVPIGRLTAARIGRSLAAKDFMPRR